MNFTDGPLRFVSFSFVTFFLIPLLIDFPFDSLPCLFPFSLPIRFPWHSFCFPLVLFRFAHSRVHPSADLKTESVQYLIRTLGVQLGFFMIPSDQLESHMFPTFPNIDSSLHWILRFKPRTLHQMVPPSFGQRLIHSWPSRNRLKFGQNLH